VLGGRYAVRRLLGVGGMGHVHDVEALATGDHFALKAPLPELATDEIILQRFAREAAALQLLDHTNIVRLADTVIDDGRFYLVLELVDGPSLADELDHGPLHPRRAGIHHADGRLDDAESLSRDLGRPKIEPPDARNAEQAQSDEQRCQGDGGRSHCLLNDCHAGPSR
jgi:serine/threonine protein kinase